ncbi:MAG TPA: ABC transporter ATP-binding protein, partial [Puia sp.]|nr:ABC transporter ATP-binding protein [Puia sp.]
MKQIIKNTIAILDRHERKKVLLFAFLDITISILDIAFLAILLFLIRFYTATTLSDRLSFLPGWLTDRHSLWPILIVFFLFCAKNGTAFLIYEAGSRLRFGIALRISQYKLLQYLEGNFKEYVNTDSSVHSGQIFVQPMEFVQNILEGLQQCIKELTLVSVAVIAVLLFNAKLFLLLLVILLPPVIIMSWLTRRKLRSAKDRIKISQDKMWQHLQESIAGFVESNLYDKNIFFVNRYSQSLRTLFKQLATLRTVQGAPTLLAEVFAVFGLLLLIVGSHLYGDGTAIQFVTLGAFLGAAYKIIPGVARILTITGQVRAYEFTLKALTPPTPASSASAPTPATPVAAPPLATAPAGPGLCSMGFHNIGFDYGQNKILRDLNFSIGPGDFLGILGDSGKGKTTVLNLLLGFLEPGQGEILINGMASDSRAIRSHWKNIAYVKQQPFIINDTMLTNITLNEENDETERLERVLSLSGLDELIKKMPGGIHSRISGEGKNISGGQRQRIAIARALYKPADLIILDEPFSELDEASEERLLAHFKKLAREGKLIILITHNKKSLSA